MAHKSSLAPNDVFTNLMRCASRTGACMGEMVFVGLKIEDIVGGLMEVREMFVIP